MKILWYRYTTLAEQEKDPEEGNHTFLLATDSDVIPRQGEDVRINKVGIFRVVDIEHYITTEHSVQVYLAQQ